MREFNHHPGDIISDPGGEDGMDADFGGAPSYRTFDISKRLVRGDIAGAIQAGRLARERFFPSAPSAADPNTSDQFPEERFDDEGPVTIRPEDV